MKVVFFHRKPEQGVNFSIENLFTLVRSALPAEVQSQVKVLRYKSRGFWRRFYITLEAAFSQGDVNHITGDVHFIALLLRKNKTILTIHDLGLMRHTSWLVRSVFRFFWITMPVKRCALVTTVSYATRAELMKHISISESKVRVVYNPVPDTFIPSPKLFNKTEPRILQIGTKANKNIDRLLEALAGISCHLQIIGRVSSVTRQKLEDLNISHTIASSLSNDEMIEQYRQADIISFVSTFEGFGIPIVEANAIGRVVVTSDCSSMPEVAGNAAHLVNPFDIAAIRAGFLRVISDDAYRDQLIQNGFENRKRFTPARIASDYLQIYNALASARL